MGTGSVRSDKGDNKGRENWIRDLRERNERLESGCSEDSAQHMKAKEMMPSLFYGALGYGWIGQCTFLGTLGGCSVASM
jgi:hypothetical protein